MRLGGILHDKQAVTPGKRSNVAHRRRVTIEVDRDDPPRFRSHAPLRRLRVDVQRSRQDIHQDRSRAAISDGVGRGDKGDGRNEHLVARLQPVGSQSEMQGRCSVGCGNGVPHPAKRGEAFLERADVFPVGGNPV